MDPATIQPSIDMAFRVSGKERLVNKLASPTKEVIFTALPRIAVVVGSFAAIPYVHLQLEARRRYWPHIPYLIQDDGSPYHKELSSLCESFGAEFGYNTTRFPPWRGDMCAMAHGMIWAQSLGCDILLKVSRRFVPVVPWADDLASLAESSQYATYCSWTTSFNFGFRTECVAFAVAEWQNLGLHSLLVKRMFDPGRIFVEGFVHALARRAADANCARAITFDQDIGARPPDRNGYAPWSFMGTDRRARSTNYLWHDWARPADYAQLAKEWDLPYSESDYRDPNMGCGRF